MDEQSKQMQHINRRLSDEERRRHDEIRAVAEKDFPPKNSTPRRPQPGELAAQIRAAREAQGLTWYALAKAASLADQDTIARSKPAAMYGYGTSKPSPRRSG